LEKILLLASSLVLEITPYQNTSIAKAVPPMTHASLGGELSAIFHPARVLPNPAQQHLLLILIGDDISNLTPIERE